ncbi:hypothetical protein AMTR_s00089p00175440 [Amborella trichopoda]|uniref:Uncharacterized protein n=1 Tax=Amborella trichopoda TaxID=13333 RepID=W1NW94_AMBTC|nr:hypothetical protein AMTR_s00089p00175440 [Amborella trichopoda]
MRAGDESPRVSPCSKTLLIEDQASKTWYADSQTPRFSIQSYVGNWNCDTMHGHKDLIILMRELQWHILVTDSGPVGHGDAIFCLFPGPSDWSGKLKLPMGRQLAHQGRFVELHDMGQQRD